VALSLALASIGVAHAQQGGGAGVLLGEVDKCVNGNETPTAGVSIGVAGANGALAKSDANGQFALTLAPGQYTIQATSDDGTTALRPYVPVEAGGQLDIGVLELAGGCLKNDIGGAAPAPAPAQAQPTAQPTVAPTAAPVPATATPVPAVVQPTATAVPAPDEQAPTDDQSPPDQPPPADTSDAG
jgi:hypothetical protein